MPHATTAVDPLQSSQWVYMRRAYFPDATVIFDPRVRVLAPAAAETPAAVPVQVRAPDLAGVTRVLVFADMDTPSRVLEFRPRRAQPSIGFAMKIQQATPVRAAMQTADGVWHVGGRWIDAQGGGCSIPALSAKPAEAELRGTVRARVWPESRDATRLKFRIAHTMDAGDVAGRPKFYVDRLQIDGAQHVPLATLALGPAVADDPMFTLRLDYRGPIVISGTDNRGHAFQSLIPTVMP